MGQCDAYDVSLGDPLHDKFTFINITQSISSNCEFGRETHFAQHVQDSINHTPAPIAEAGMIFLEWMATQEFAELYTNALPGFFTLANHEISVDDPLAQEFISWRGECESTIRSSYQILSRGEPNLENELWRVNALLLNGELTAAEAGAVLQDGLASWYEPMMSE